MGAKICTSWTDHSITGKSTHLDSNICLLPLPQVHLSNGAVPYLPFHCQVLEQNHWAPNALSSNCLQGRQQVLRSRHERQRKQPSTTACRPVRLCGGRRRAPNSCQSILHLAGGLAALSRRALRLNADCAACDGRPVLAGITPPQDEALTADAASAGLCWPCAWVNIHSRALQLAPYSKAVTALSRLQGTSATGNTPAALSESCQPAGPQPWHVPLLKPVLRWPAQLPPPS